MLRAILEIVSEEKADQPVLKSSKTTLICWNKHYLRNIRSKLLNFERWGTKVLSISLHKNIFAFSGTKCVFCSACRIQSEFAWSQARKELCKASNPSTAMAENLRHFWMLHPLALQGSPLGSWLSQRFCFSWCVLQTRPGCSLRMRIVVLRCLAHKHCKEAAALYLTSSQEQPLRMLAQYFWCFTTAPRHC